MAQVLGPARRETRSAGPGLPSPGIGGEAGGVSSHCDTVGGGGAGEGDRAERLSLSLAPEVQMAPKEQAQGGCWRVPPWPGSTSPPSAPRAAHQHCRRHRAQWPPEQLCPGLRAEDGAARPRPWVHPAGSRAQRPAGRRDVRLGRDWGGWGAQEPLMAVGASCLPSIPH